MTVNGVNVAVQAVADMLGNHAAVSSCSVLAEADGSGETQLFAAITLTSADTDTDTDTLKQELRALLREQLGAAAVPRYFALLDSLPMLPNGKVDRRMLRGLIGDGVTWQR